MQRFSREQKVYSIGGIQIGGHPGEKPTVLIGSIFFSKHQIVSDPLRGIFDKDINEIQLAKAAIRTGIHMLSEKVGISWKEIEDVIITGGFGSSLNPESALTIGRFPPFKSEQFQLVGNAAGTGSKLCLISKSQGAKAQEIAKQIHYLELMTHSKFPTRFSNAMFFQ